MICLKCPDSTARTKVYPSAQLTVIQEVFDFLESNKP